MSSAQKRTLDFSNVKEMSGINPRRMPAGDYLARVIEVEEEVSSKDQVPMWKFTIQLKEHQTATYPYYCKLQENQLWKIRNLLVAAGKAVPSSKVKVDPSKVLNTDIMVALEDDEYEGRQKSTIAGVFPVDSSSSVGSEPDDDDEELEDL